MAENKNALAELAEELNRVDAHEPELWVGHRKAVRKAQRIVAELAKVGDGEWVEDCGGIFYLCRAESRFVGTVVGRCRAIAEEGGEA